MVLALLTTYLSLAISNLTIMRTDSSHLSVSNLHHHGRAGQVSVSLVKSGAEISPVTVSPSAVFPARSRTP